MIEIPKEEFESHSFKGYSIEISLFDDRVRFRLTKKGSSGNLSWETPRFVKSKVRIQHHGRATKSALKRTIEEYLTRIPAMKEEFFDQLFE